jgi:cell wall-associated NlpC family hydrolase
MRYARFVCAIALLATLPVLAQQGDTDTSPTPGPSPAHHRHAHARHSPSPSPTPDESEAAAEADLTPAAKVKRHHHATADEESENAGGISSPSPDETNTLSIATPSPKPKPSVGPDASLSTGQLKEFADQPANIQALIESSLALTRQNLTYTYSSDDPANGGMDCSGFIYYVLTQAGVKDVPRDSIGQYEWVWKAHSFRAVNSRNIDSFEMDDLKPGDLLFWTGTYTTDRDPPVTHIMLYLGREKETGDRVMVGSSDGRSYHGIQRWGVSVFDFKAPPPENSSRSTSRFIGYGSVPGL